MREAASNPALCEREGEAIMHHTWEPEMTPAEYEADPDLRRVVSQAADLCRKFDDADPDIPDSRFYSVDQFIGGLGKLFASVDYQEEHAFVVVRGTRDIGNWMLTNFQAYKTKFRVFDDQLSRPTSDTQPRIHIQPKRVQGSSCYAPIPGHVHQGFYRAASWLWYGGEPILDYGTVESDPFRQRLTRLAIFALVPWVFGSAIAIHFTCLMSYALWSLSLAPAIAIIEYERGTFEGVFKRSPASRNEDPRCLMGMREKFSRCDHVWFVVLRDSLADAERIYLAPTGQFTNQVAHLLLARRRSDS